MVHHENIGQVFPRMGVADLLGETYRRFQEQRRILGQGNASPTIVISGYTIGAGLSAPEANAGFCNALPGYWEILPASQCVTLGGENIALPTISSASGTFAALVDIASSSAETAFQVDLNHHGAIFRWVFLEKVLGRIIVLDGQGEIVFLEEISVNPLLQIDLVFSCHGAYIRNIEKKSTFPLTTDWEKLFPPIVSPLPQPAPTTAPAMPPATASSATPPLTASGSVTAP